MSQSLNSFYVKYIYVFAELNATATIATTFFFPVRVKLIANLGILSLVNLLALQVGGGEGGVAIKIHFVTKTSIILSKVLI